MDRYRRTSLLSPEPRGGRTANKRPSLLQRIRRRFGFRSEQDEMELPWFLDGITVLSPEGSAEVLDEIKNGSPLTPERAATFERMRARQGVRARLAEIEGTETDDPYRRTPMLSPEGSREVEEEMANPPADTPGRRALFERVEVRAAMRRRVEEMERSLRKS